MSKTKRYNSRTYKKNSYKNLIYKSVDDFKSNCVPAMVFFLCFIFNIVYYIYVLVKIVKPKSLILVRPGSDKKSEEGAERVKVLLFFEFVFILFVSLIVLWIIITLCSHKHYTVAWCVSILFGFGWPIYQLTSTS